MQVSKARSGNVTSEGYSIPIYIESLEFDIKNMNVRIDRTKKAIELANNGKY